MMLTIKSISWMPLQSFSTVFLVKPSKESYAIPFPDCLPLLIHLRTRKAGYRMRFTGSRFSLYEVQLLVVRQSQLPVHLSLNIIAWIIVLHISLLSMIVAVSCMHYAGSTGSIWKVLFGGYFTSNRNWISRSIHVHDIPIMADTLWYRTV